MRRFDGFDDWPVSGGARPALVADKEVLNHGVYFATRFLVERRIRQMAKPVDAACLQQRSLRLVPETVKLFALRLRRHA